MYKALAATSKTLQTLLDTRLRSDGTLGGLFSGTLSVSLDSPVEMQDDNKEGLSVWLYRVVRDEQRVNAPPERINRTQVRRPPLPLRLHYLITPVLKNVSSASTETEQQILGKALQVLHDHPVLFGSDLQDVFVGTATELNVRLESLSLEETAHVREILKLDDPYELAVRIQRIVETMSVKADR